MRNKIIYLSCLWAILVGCPQQEPSPKTFNLEISWSPSEGANIYYIYYTKESGKYYPLNRLVAFDTSFAFSYPLAYKETVYFVITAIDDSNNESERSEEVSFTFDKNKILSKNYKIGIRMP